MDEKLTAMTVRQLSEGLTRKTFSAAEVTESFLEQIRTKEESIGAYITVLEKQAITQAEEIDRRRIGGEVLSPLAGIPGGIKDNMCTKGVLTSCASKMLSNFIPPYSATVVEKLEAQGVILLGKLNLDEFAMGSTTENSYYHSTKNPWNLNCVPGGSSGGSAASVAAEEAAFALGSDTGGSIRQPAAFCGVVGMKPTYGSVSRYGLVAFASSLDQIGPLTKNVEDNAILLNAMIGPDSRDSTSVWRNYDDCTTQLGQEIRGMKIALPREYFGEGLSKDVKQGILDAADRFRRLGAEIVDTSLPSLSYALPAYYVISSAEASSNLARFDGVKYGYRAKDYTDMDTLYKKTRSEGFGKEVKRRIMLGSFALSSGYYEAYYQKALQIRTLVVNDFQKIFETCDMILSPVAPTTAYRLGEKTENPLEMYLGDIYTVPVNIAGLPALAMPCGISSTGLPLGMQLIGKAFDEASLYRAGYAFEQSMKEGI